MSNSRPDPKRRSFWQFQGVVEDPNAKSGNWPAMVAVFRHAVEERGVVALSEDIVFPNKRTFTLSELVAIKMAPAHPKAPRFKPEEAEKNRQIVNLARAGLTAKEFGRALDAMSIKAARVDTIIEMPKDTIEKFELTAA